MSGRINRAAWMLAVAFAWLWTWRHLSVEWRTNEQYQFGFGIPFLFAYAAWKRWSGPSAPARCGAGCACVLAFAWLSFALGELLRWHDPIWRLTGALLALGSTLLTAVWFYRTGGRTLLRREMFPLAFAWLAVPWPVPAEFFVTQRLLHFITWLAITFVNNLGVAALQRGNAIELANGVVGMDDACSGIRSLQAALMASLFLGEFFRLGVARRCGLLLGGWLASMGSNFFRVLFLIFVLHTEGTKGEAHYHDLAGGIATALAFASIFFLAVRMSKPAEQPAETDVKFPALPGAEGSVALGCALAIPMLAWFWFSRMEIPASELPQMPQWKLDAGRLPSGWSAEQVEPTPAERAALQFSEWHAFHLQSREGWSAQVIHLVWHPGTSMPSMAFYHTPAMCMPWIGWTQVGQPSSIVLDVDGERLPCVAYRFRQGEATQVAIQSLSSGGKGEQHFVEADRIGGRVRRLSTLWRAPLRQVNEELLVYMPDLGSADLQTAAFTELLQTLLVKTSPK